MAWATGADVVTLTGHPADDEKIAIAQILIEMFVGRTEDTADIGADDLAWLKRAVAYQAVWLEGQPDLFTRLDVTQLSQDGMQAAFKGDGLVLAPLAKRAIRQLSWKGGTRSISVEPFQPVVVGRYPIGGPIVDYDWERWRRL